MKIKKNEGQQYGRASSDRGQVSRRYAESISSGRKGVSNRSHYWPTSALVGSQLAQAEKKRFFSQSKERCHNKDCPCFQCLRVCLVGGCRPMAVDAGQLQMAIVLLGELDPMSASLRSLFAWAPRCTNTVAHHAPPGWLASGIHSARARQAFIYAAADTQSSLASPRPEHLYPACLRGHLGENLEGKSLPFLISRDTALPYICSVNDKRKKQ